MTGLTEIIVGAHVVIWGAALIILIFLIIHQLKIKKTENFEDRDN